MREDDSIVGFARGEVLRALEENLWELWSHFGLGPSCNLYDEDGALWFDTPIPTLPYNTVLRFVVRDDADQRIDALVEHYRRRGVPFLWFVHPSSQPSDLGDRLRQRGLKEVEVVPGMAANLADLPAPSPIPDGYEIREVNESSMSEWYEIVAWRWNVPPEARPHLLALNQEFRIGMPSAKIRCWLAWHGEMPVCKGVLHCAAGAAGLYGVATKPEARKLGLGRAVAIEALRSAYEDGYEMGILHSSPMAVRLYAKLGFRSVEPFRIFASRDIRL
jgi:GNAT superfamily N-acetyltransferase